MTPWVKPTPARNTLAKPAFARYDAANGSMPEDSLMKIVQAVRSALFYFFFIGQTALVAITIGIIALISGRTPLSWAMAQYWCRSNLAFLRVFTGVKTKVSGEENIPE